MNKFEHPIYTEGEPLLGTEEQNEVNALRRKQIESVDGLSNEEQSRLIEPQEKEAVTRKEKKSRLALDHTATENFISRVKNC